MLDASSQLVVMDWAMKFLQLRYREKQSDWYGKRRLSWHVSSVVSRDELTKKLQKSSRTRTSLTNVRKIGTRWHQLLSTC